MTDRLSPARDDGGNAGGGSTATIKDVARVSGVSIATVSHVLNDTRYVADGTRQRVLRAMESLDYRPNWLARSLKTKRTRTLGLVISDIENPFFTSVARGVEDEALRRGYHVVLCNTDEDPAREAEYLNELSARQVDGLIVASSASRDECPPMLANLSIPIVLLDREVSGIHSPVIRADNVEGMRIAVGHLGGLGHQRIGLVSGPLNKMSGYERYTGYLRALEEFRLGADPDLVADGDFRMEGGQRAAAALMALEDPPTAVIVANNLMTLGALQTLRSEGHQVPAAVSVVGFDDMPWASLLDPPLTTVAQPARLIGKAALELLVLQIEKGRDGPGAERVFLSPELKVRASTAPPRSRR